MSIFRSVQSETVSKSCKTRFSNSWIKTPWESQGRWANKSTWTHQAWTSQVSILHRRKVRSSWRLYSNNTKCKSLLRKLRTTGQCKNWATSINKNVLWKYQWNIIKSREGRKRSRIWTRKITYNIVLLRWVRQQLKPYLNLRQKDGKDEEEWQGKLKRILLIKWL